MISSQNCQCRAVPQRRHTVLSKSLTILLPKRRNLAASVLVKPRVPEPIWKTSWEGRPSVSRRPWL